MNKVQELSREISKLEQQEAEMLLNIKETEDEHRRIKELSSAEKVKSDLLKSQELSSGH